MNQNIEHLFQESHCAQSNYKQYCGNEPENKNEQQQERRILIILEEQNHERDDKTNMLEERIELERNILKLKVRRTKRRIY